MNPPPERALESATPDLCRGVPSQAGLRLDQVDEASAPVWDRLVEDVDPASMLVVIQSWLGAAVSRWHTAEDVWQETLLEAWRDRATFEWRGAAAFRQWLLTIARHRIRDFAEHATALKRGAGRERRMADVRPFATSSAEAQHYAGPVVETSPDRIAMDRERAEAMERALTALPHELSVVLRQRLFEDQPLELLAPRLGIGVEAARYRFRKAARLYRDALRRAAVLTSQPDGAATVD